MYHINFKIVSLKIFFKIYFAFAFNLCILVIADFGGLLGLFLGCSLLSMIEVLYFIGIVLKKKWHDRMIIRNKR